MLAGTGVKTMVRRVALFLIVLAAGCAQPPESRVAAAAVEPAGAAAVSGGAVMDAGVVRGAAMRGAAMGGANGALVAWAPGQGFANLPDRGDLLSYRGTVVRRDGAYTSYRTQLSEQHALRAITQGHLHVTTPAGEMLDFQYDHHVEHASGDWTWVGHLAGQEAEQAILTFGEHAAFGSIAQPDQLPLRLDVRDGASWITETDPVKVAGIVNSATRPREPDYRILDRSLLRGYRGPQAASAQPVALASTAQAVAKPTVDVVIGYTAGFAADNGGNSGAVTRLNHLIAVANEAYGNSQLSAQARLVKAIAVTYTETNSNDTALEQLSGYRSGVGSVTPNAAFNALRAARETYGADLVSLVRKFREPEHGGCGLAWLLGGGKQGIQANAGWDDLAYSVVGDGHDAGTDGKSYYCLDETLAHEMGHNMGSAHDRDTAAGDDGVLDNPDDYGAYEYSFGYRTSNGNFHTVMAYGDTGQQICRVFSNPRITFCGGHVSGIANVADNERSLSVTFPVVSGFRATKVVDPAPVATRELLRGLDAHNDGRSDLVFFNHAQARVSSWYMSGSTRIASSAFGLAAGWQLVDAADFDGNGSDDLLFTSSGRKFKIALSHGTGYTIASPGYMYASTQQPIAAADINGNGRADILLRDPATGTVTIWYMSGATRVSYNYLSVAPGYRFVGHGDLNGDHRQDLLWTNASRQLLLRTSLGTSFSSQTLGLGYQAGYSAAGLQDINGDGRDDIVLAKDDGLRLVTWFMNGATRTTYASTTTSASFRLVAKGDFNGDGRGDLAQVNPSTRQIRLLTSTGSNFTASNLALIPQAGSDLMDVQL
jgi:hypothetical protein